MLKKTLLVAAACALTFCFITGNSIAEVNKGPKEMVLKTAKAKKPAKFNHAAHQEKLECATCHHTKTADGKKGPYVAGEEAKCESCHNKKDMTNKKINSFKNAAHKNCKACHKKEKKAGKKAPTKCTGCHVKGLK
jgi:hypothetical protein